MHRLTISLTARPDRTSICLPAAALLLAASAVSAPSARAETPVLIKNKARHKFCIGKSSRGWGNGTNITLMRCKDGTDAMKTWVYDRDTGYIRSAANPSKCMQKRSPGWKNGNNIHLWDCNRGSKDNKTWIVEEKSGHIRAAGNRSMCMQKKYPDWRSGNNIHLWNCNVKLEKNAAWKLVRQKASLAGMMKKEEKTPGVQSYYIKNHHGLCLTVNVFDRKKSRREKAKRVMKTMFDPREHAKNLAGLSGGFFLGPGGPEMVTSVRTLRMKADLEKAWRGDPGQGMGVTQLRCGSVDPRYQQFIRDGRFLRTRDGKYCVKAKQGQARDNGGRVQIGQCRHQQRAAWYVNGHEFKNGKGKCLDVHRPDRTHEGARVQLWSCTGRSQQQWTFSYP
jgi:hypothetical protein